MDDAPPFAAALGRLEELSRAAELLALLRSASELGLLRQLVTPCTPTVDDVDPDRLTLVLELMATHDVVERVGDGWRLTEGWRQLIAGETPFDVEAGIGMTRVRAGLAGAALAKADRYAELPPADRLTTARAMSFDPSGDAGVALIRGAVTGHPGILAAVEAGGPVLELGCGIGSRMTALARSYPLVRCTGVELDPDLAAFGRARAERLGVADRVTWVVADVTTWVPDRAYPVVQWSQFFFPRETREAALRTARAALEPDGWLQMPVMWDGEPLPPGVASQEMAAERLLLDLWGIPLRSVPDMERELRDAGFVDVTSEPAPGVVLVRARNPR